MSMLSRTFGSDASDILAAFHASQAIIEFKLDGTIITANPNFCRAIGYELSEIVGKHHRLFVDPRDAESPAYREFWTRLGRGEFDTGTYRRLAKGGREIWIQASYNPVLRGKRPTKVVKIASDITAAKLKAVEDDGKLSALSRGQALIEFTPTGEVLTANENFCNAMGYQLAEIVGRHHSMFCDPTYVKGDEYRQFWQQLAAGQYAANEFRRFGKGGREVWIQASYNPILDANGKVTKVVKIATDVTERMSAIGVLGTALKNLSEGDLVQRLDSPFVPTMEGLRHDFNEVIARLRTTMETVGQNAQAIAAGSGEIRAAADDLAKRTEQQAASIEETAATLEEMTVTVSDSSKRAEEAGQLVAKTREHAERSGHVVRNAVAAMEQIDKSSREISNIIGVIDDIAFQTNLLALNAGVEAARAGEAGRGFAVVAQEVRELAQRSASAAKEIKTLIGNANAQVKNGVSLVGETGKALEEIVTQVQAVNRNVAAIVEGSREQATGLAGINQAVNTIDQGTQQNAAMVEQSTAASHSLAREAEELFRILASFKTGAEEMQMRRAPAAQPKPVTHASRLVASPARAMAGRVAQSFRTNGSAAVKEDDWQEF